MDQSAETQNTQQSPIQQLPTPPIPPATVQTQKPSKTYFKRLFSERLNRRNYFLGILVSNIVFYPLAFIVALTFGPDVSPDLAIFYEFFLVFSLFFAAFQLSLTLRRLHDINLSGWFVIIYMLILIISPNLFSTLGGNFIFVTIISFLIYAVQILLIILPGSSGDNKYGAKPLPRLNFLKDILQLL